MVLVHVHDIWLPSPKLAPDAEHRGERRHRAHAAGDYNDRDALASQPVEELVALSRRPAELERVGAAQEPDVVAGAG